jgi:hypothetical protein
MKPIDELILLRRENEHLRSLLITSKLELDDVKTRLCEVNQVVLELRQMNDFLNDADPVPSLSRMN